MSHAQVGTLGKEIGNCEWFGLGYRNPKPWADIVYNGSFGASFLEGGPTGVLNTSERYRVSCQLEVGFDQTMS